MSIPPPARSDGSAGEVETTVRVLQRREIADAINGDVAVAAGDVGTHSAHSAVGTAAGTGVCLEENIAGATTQHRPAGVQPPIAGARGDDRTGGVDGQPTRVRGQIATANVDAGIVGGHASACALDIEKSPLR